MTRWRSASSRRTITSRRMRSIRPADHDTLAAFRRRFLDEIKGLFEQVLLLAREMGVLKLGTVSLDGTKIHMWTARPRKSILQSCQPAQRAVL